MPPASVSCNLCHSCTAALCKVRVDGCPALQVPLKARARGLWNGPEPEEIRRLTYTARRVLRLARVYAVVKRVAPRTVPWAHGSEAARPQYSTRNTVAYAQDPDVISRTLCLTPAELAQDLYVQFEGYDDNVVKQEPALQINMQDLRSGLYWLLTHNWQWLEATKDHDILGLTSLGEYFEQLLQTYQVSLDGGEHGVPNHIFTVATRMHSEKIHLTYPGPAQAIADSESDDGVTPRPKSAESNRGASHGPPDASAAILDTGLHDLSPLRLWDLAMQKYEVLQQLESQYNRASEAGDNDLKMEAIRGEALALADAVHALRALRSNEARQKLDEYYTFLVHSEHTVRIPHRAAVLNSFAPDWWVLCFTDLFYRCDFIEQPGLGFREWAKLLLRRMDFLGWASSDKIRSHTLQHIFTTAANVGCCYIHPFKQDLENISRRSTESVTS